jgi:hypothetical protein
MFNENLSVSSKVTGGEEQACGCVDMKNETGWLGFDSWHESWEFFSQGEENEV